MLYKVLLILSHVSMISSSHVLDSPAQRSVYVTDYCPKMQFCPEGAHVMCMYYDAKNKMGPRCNNVQNVSMTPELANKLLDVSNAVRSRIAQGKEKGKNGDFLPRGYGVFRLKWDTELATFAQVLANQCVLKHDLCRASKSFPDPGQTAGLVRFTYPDWLPVSKSGNFTTTGISSAKLLYATNQILKSWYGQKNSVTPSMITYYPDWALDPANQNGRLYMEMIYGSATHMGCGISAYTAYAFYDNNAALNYNSVQIICNYSARPRKGTAVYNTVPPGDTTEPFSQCGCPIGSTADEDCLCQHVERKPVHPLVQLKAKTRKCPDGKTCDPTVVVLPIFTVEDAPPEKLFTHGSFGNASIRKQINEDIFQRGGNSFQSKRNLYAADKIVSSPQAHKLKGKSEKQFRSQQNIRPTSHHGAVAIRKRYFDKKHIESNPQESGQSPRAIQNAVRKKTSLFSRAAKFELPGTLIIRPIKPAGIKDVVPRKDFSTAKQLVNKYLFGKNDLMKHQYKNNPLNEGNKAFDKREQSKERQGNEASVTDSKRNNVMKPFFNEIHEMKTFDEHEQPNDETINEQRIDKDKKTFKNKIEPEHNLHDVFNIINATRGFKASKDIAKYQKIQRPTTETVLNTAEQKIITQDSFLKQIVSNTNDYNKPLNSVTEETDNKLMALLDTLEQEVKHVELREKDKRLFDAKIRKIYGKVVGKPVSLLDFNINKHDKKHGEEHFVDEVKKSYLIEKSVQQDPKEESVYEKYRTKMEGLDELSERRLESKDRYNNSTRDRNELVKYEDGSSYKKRYGLRGIKHSDISHEQMRSRYRDYENNHEYGERKTYRNNNFDRNALEDEPRHRITDNHYRGRNIERDRHNDEIEHTNELERRGRKHLDHHHSNDRIDQAIRNKNYYLSNDAVNDDPLSVERRRFYQEKLENIERRLQMRNYKRRKDTPRHMRPMRPASKKFENQMDIYGRARFAHGY